MNAVNISVVESDSIDLVQYCLFQKAAFKNVFKEYEMDDSYITPEFFEWKYNTPAGKAKIALAKREETIIASVAICPHYFLNRNEVITIWQSGDVAVIPGEEGKWLFAKCMKAVMEYLPAGSFLYGFPNKKSFSGALRLSYKPIMQLGFYIKFNPFLKNSKGKACTENFNSAQDQYAKKIVDQTTIVLYRSAAYMNWRYLKKPATNYFIHTTKRNNQVTGNIVLCTTEIKERRILLVMEYHYLDNEAKSALFTFMKATASQEKCRFIGMFSGKKFAPDFWSSMFFKVPDRFLPKQQILVGTYNNNNFQSELLQSEWLVQTGDWDAF
ncbi:MAG: GNAT family N-acetyltransferase [Sphingobacteriales bacterium]|nr:GNAT family N-acetyltransferase [Sphingobacteriales bacterium]